MKPLRLITGDELAGHSARSTPNDGSLWMAIDGTVYDLASFKHPGGRAILERYSGMEATVPFMEVHPRDLAKRLLDASKIVGKLDVGSLRDGQVARGRAEEETERRLREDPLPPLETMLNSFDFESLARRRRLNTQAWGYYSSGADDEITLRENRAAFLRVWLKPRILVDVKRIDTSTTICGAKSSIPLYISATALGKLAHPDGEGAIVRAAARAGIPYMLPTLSSCT